MDDKFELEKLQSFPVLFVTLIRQKNGDICDIYQQENTKRGQKEDKKRMTQKGVHHFYVIMVNK